MHKKIFYIAVLLLFIATQFAVSQNNTNSPYTRFGYGELTEGSAIELRGMGGVGLANRSKNTINALNPASYSSVDTMTFMFDVAMGTRLSRFSDNSASSSTFNANLEYLTIRFPLAKWLGFSAGLLPYSFMGYNFYQADTLVVKRQTPIENDRKVGFTRSYNGLGGISQIYGGLSANILNHVSVGVNTYYMFGNSSNNRSLIFAQNSGVSSSIETNQINVSDVRFRYGIQLYNTFAKKHNVTLGVIYENKTKLNGSFSQQINNTQIDYNDGFELPQVLGAGLNYNFDNRLTLGVDYLQQSWKDALYFSKTDSLVNRTKIGFGAEYTPNPMGRRFSQRVRYRVGFSTGNQYYKVNNQTQPNDFTVSFGVGLPTRTSKSWMNAAVEYGRIGSASTLKEDYLKLTFSASIDEIWFFKPQLK